MTVLFRIFRPGMQGVMPFSCKASRNQSACITPVGEHPLRFGQTVEQRGRARVIPADCPAVIEKQIGRPFASVTACSLVFMPPFVRPIRRWTPFLPQGWTPCGAL